MNIDWIILQSRVQKYSKSQKVKLKTVLFHSYTIHINMNKHTSLKSI